jgi:predicted RNA-binding Zn-ribbon protein involved in translation (DUF1610 family)
MPNDEQLTSHNIERPDCGHMQIVRVRTQQGLADYNFRVVPELREALQKPCPKCEEEKTELAREKLVQEMQEKAKSK